MNKTYRKSIAVYLDKRYCFYRLNRSVRRRDVRKLFGMKEAKMPTRFFAASRNVYDYGKRSVFHYNENYVQIQNHLWKLDHGKFKTLPRNSITEDYKFRCRRAVC